MIVSGKNPNRAYIAWSFSSMCNQACWYCPEFLHDNKVPFPEYDDAMYLIDLVYEKNEEVIIEISGGEPTLWPKLTRFLRAAIEKYPNLTIQVDTNGSRTNKWWERFTSFNFQNNLWFNFAHHAEQCDIDLFYENTRIASEAGYSCTVNFMLDPPYFDIQRKYYEKARDNLNAYVCMKTLRPGFDADKIIDGYTDEMFEIIKESHTYVQHQVLDNAPSVNDDLRIFYDGKLRNYQDEIINKRNSFTFWHCQAGTKRVVITIDGNVYPCFELSKVFGNEGPTYCLGNIKERNVNLKDDGIICPASYCGCLPDALVYKTDE